MRVWLPSGQKCTNGDSKGEGVCGAGIYPRSVSFSILQIGELSGGLSAEYRQATANRVQWGPMKAMRNLVAHNYGRMDQAIIWETATVDIPALLQFCEEQLSEK